MTVFADHQPEHPYVLTRDQFAQFAGIAPMVAAFRAAIQADADRRGQEPYRLEERAFWSAIAAFEAVREFSPFVGACGSELAMDTHGDRPGLMAWRYWTTSGTHMSAVEYREYTESGDLPEPVFTVTIPLDRDQPGRYHYEQLRNGGSYCE